MTKLLLVRHGRAAAGWGDDLDPGLDDVGRRQAAAMADAVGALGPMPIVVSPLRRTRETAALLESRWQRPARVDPGVGEIPSPTLDLEARQKWLRAVMQGSWADCEAPLRDWRQRVLEALAALEEDSVVVTHFVVLNVAVGAARGDDRVVCFTPANCSVTTLDLRAGELSVVELGDQGATAVA